MGGKRSNDSTHACSHNSSQRDVSLRVRRLRVTCFRAPGAHTCFPHATIMPADVWFLLITHDERPLGNVLCVAVEDGANVHSFLEKSMFQKEDL